MEQLLKQILPLIGIMVFVMFAWVAKLLMDRQRYAKQAKDNVQVTIYRAGRQPWRGLIRVEEIGGQPVVKIPMDGKYKDEPPIHILGGSGQYPDVYPLGKIAFVQASVPAVSYIEGDLEPIVAGDVPIVSAQRIASMIQGVSLATSDAMQRSQEESTGHKLKKSSGLIWVYVLLGICLVVGVVGVVLTAKNGGDITSIVNWGRHVGGIK